MTDVPEQKAFAEELVVAASCTIPLSRSLDTLPTPGFVRTFFLIGIKCAPPGFARKTPYFRLFCIG